MTNVWSRAFLHLFGRLKRYKRITLRCEKTERNFQSIISFVAGLCLIKFVHMTKIKHLWTNGQVERMNRTIKEATVKRYHYDSHDQFKRHLNDFIYAYNSGKRLKTLKGLTPYEYICKRWTIEPEKFTLDPTHQMPGLNT